MSSARPGATGRKADSKTVRQQCLTLSGVGPRTERRTVQGTVVVIDKARYYGGQFQDCLSVVMRAKQPMGHQRQENSLAKDICTDIGRWFQR